jgi:cytochrome c5
MSHSHDRQFVDLCTLVVGVLVGIAVGIYFIATYIGNRTQGVQVRTDEAYQHEVAARIAPFGRVAIAGQDNSALAPAEPPTASATAAVANVDLSGEEVFSTACVACHGQGIAGAPRKGDAAAWEPRIAKGIDVLHKHAIEGFQGSAGLMPAKGGRVDLSDESVIRAVDYMIEADGKS